MTLQLFGKKERKRSHDGADGEPNNAAFFNQRRTSTGSATSSSNKSATDMVSAESTFSNIHPTTTPRSILDELLPPGMNNSQILSFLGITHDSDDSAQQTEHVSKLAQPIYNADGQLSGAHKKRTTIFLNGTMPMPSVKMKRRPVPLSPPPPKPEIFLPNLRFPSIRPTKVSTER